IVALFASAYLGSQSFLTRVQDIASDLRTWQRGAHDETSVGVRIGYYLTSLEIIADHPLTGTGVGGFAPAYAEKIRGTAAPATVNPHNDYLMFAVQAGLPAAALVLAFYLFLWRDARKLGSRLERDLMRGFVITFALGGLFNSLLMDHVEGLLLAWATGLLFASHTNTHAANRAPQVRAGSWRRLTDGACDTYARPDWPAFAGADWATRIMHVGVTDDFHEKQGRSTGRWVLQSGSAQLVVYLKRHYRHPRWRGLLAALWPGRGWSAGMLECRHLQWALSQGLCVPKIAAAGEFVGPWGKMQSFLAIEELTGMLPLDQAIPMASRQLEAGAFRIWKAGLALEVARLARFLHDRNLFHRDLYLCHFYVSRADTARVPEWTHKVCMIDFHRLAHHSVARTPWISKDLGQLMFSSDVEGIDTRDRVRFWRAYLGSDRRSLSGGWLRRLVLLRARRYRRHNTKAGARVS
ncbi:MAG TPA: lipopolysaccharide kinase InaA family protein, partial [Burkholderiales bacterium]|nr:lipopolysaccharide kinase InaA family protein [Burkholderiales bacterium]